jgi:pimeloyl-ACP methyl ester carboxylesterase
MPIFPSFRVALVLALLSGAIAGAAEASGIRLEGYEYPFPEKVHKFRSQQQDLEMVYMDVAPATGVRGTVVLLHGKNFSGSYFSETMRALYSAGYRVIVPDQIGFGKSTKPPQYQYSLHQLAANTRGLLQTLGISGAHVLGHSMGGMVATRFALTFPASSTSLTLVNPLGLKDWKALGVPYTTIDENYRSELRKTRDSIRSYQLAAYYDNQWREAYDPCVDQTASFAESPDYPRMAWNQALTSDMVFTQPVVHELHRLRMPVLLIIG